MKTFLLKTLLSTLMAGAAIAHAQDTGTSTYRLAPHEFGAFAGVYTFDSGDVLKVWSQDGHYYVKFRNQVRHEITATAPGQFEMDASTRIAFDSDGRSVSITRTRSVPELLGSIVPF